ncbi:hypothetical protein HDU76_008855 [Blyttiomyces sp. JEL0837]|nr:hypothetical protein HDU76_008855 [Blyttiomyces sp. JEL0837]
MTSTTTQSTSSAAANVGCFASPTHLALFEESLDLIFQRWTALQLAITHDMGGRNTLQKVAVLDYGLAVEDSELEENLQGYFDECFHVSLEDGSPTQVAKSLCKVFKELAEGNLSTLEALRKATAGRAQRADGGGAVSGSQRGRANADDDEDDDDDSDDDDDEYLDEDDLVLEVADGEAGSSAMEIVAEPPRRPEPVVDEDGFELVQKPRRRR